MDGRHAHPYHVCSVIRRRFQSQNKFKDLDLSFIIELSKTGLHIWGNFGKKQLRLITEERLYS